MIELLGFGKKRKRGHQKYEPHQEQMIELFSTRRVNETRQKNKVDEFSDLDSRLVALLDPMSPAAEAYRILRTNLLHTDEGEPPKVIVMTSSHRHEGKSIACANLAVALAQVGKRTILVDCDFRAPTQHSIFRMHSLEGLTNVLDGRSSLTEVGREPVRNLKVVSAGRTPSDPSAVLDSECFAQFLSYVRKEFDYVLIDVAPTESVSDPLILAAQGDGVLLVLDARSRRASIRQSMLKLEAVGGNIIGTVVTNV